MTVRNNITLETATREKLSIAGLGSLQKFQGNLGVKFPKNFRNPSPIFFRNFVFFFRIFIKLSSDFLGSLLNFDI